MSLRRERKAKHRQLEAELKQVVLQHNKYCDQLERMVRSQAEWDLLQQYQHPFQEMNDLYVKFMSNMAKIKPLEDQIKANAQKGQQARFNAAKAIASKRLPEYGN